MFSCHVQGVCCLWIGFCVLKFLSTLSDFFFITETDTKNDYSQELGNLQNLNDKIEENTNIAKLPIAKYVAIFVKVYKLFTIAELLILVGLCQLLS